MFCPKSSSSHLYRQSIGRMPLGRAISTGQKQWQPILGIEFPGNQSEVVSWSERAFFIVGGICFLSISAQHLALADPPHHPCLDLFLIVPGISQTQVDLSTLYEDFSSLFLFSFNQSSVLLHTLPVMVNYFIFSYVFIWFSIIHHYLCQC